MVCTSRRRNRGNQIPEKVNVVVRVNALKHRRDALESHARVDAGPRKIGHGPIGSPFELHEDEIPDFDVPITILFGRPRGTAPDLRTVVVEDLRARAARAGVSHGPEIVRITKASDAVGRHTDLFDPDALRLVIGVVNRHPQAIGRQAEALSQQRPGHTNGFGLEIIAEAEIAKHLEEGVVPSCIADVLEVVVLATSTHASLRTGRTPVVTRFTPREHVLERHHSRVREQERRIVAGDEGATRDCRVTFSLEIFEKGSTYVGAFHDQLFVKAVATWQTH